MATDQPNEAAQFHQFLGEQIDQGTNLPPEDILDAWRETHPAIVDDDMMAAVEEALDDMDAGDIGITVEDHLKQLREQFGLKER
jgi:hypothetical protein